MQALVLALGHLETILPTLAREKGGRLEHAGEHERLIVADTFLCVLRWNAVENLIDGLSRAVGLLEVGRKPPKAVLDGLRKLVASSGVAPVGGLTARASRRSR